MAITVTASITSGPVVADATANGTLTITNAGSNTISVYAAQLSEQTTMGAMFGQPPVLPANNAPGVYNTIAAGSSASYPFSVVIPSPNTPGDSPNSPNTFNDAAYPAANSRCIVNVIVTTYDSTAGAYVNGSAQVSIPVGSAVAPFPVPQGGALQFNTGGDAVHWFFL